MIINYNYLAFWLIIIGYPTVYWTMIYLFERRWKKPLMYYLPYYIINVVISGLVAYYLMPMLMGY